MFIAVLLGHGSNLDVHRQMNGWRSVVYVYNGVLFNQKKEHIWVSSNEVDEHKPHYIQSELS